MNDLARVRRAAEKATTARQEFEQVIREAARTETLRAVAEAAGLSHQRIHQIVKRVAR